LADETFLRQATLGVERDGVRANRLSGFVDPIGAAETATARGFASNAFKRREAPWQENISEFSQPKMSPH